MNSCGDRLPLQDAAPPLQATLQAPFLSRGRESLGAPLPPGTIVEGLGAKAVLTARWGEHGQSGRLGADEAGGHLGAKGVAHVVQAPKAAAHVAILCFAAS